MKLVDDDTDDTVAEYAYDGANRRIVQKSYSGGDLDETRHLYYTQPSQWQVVEERVEDDADPERQFVWGLQYIDDLILRDRDTNGDGSLNERLYSLQDANWNLTGLIDTSGDVQERYAFSAYGTPKFLTPAFGNRASSSFDWETLYAGYRWETATRLFHVRHRVLNSVIGTWCQRDPIELIPEVNLYQYVASSPVDTIDGWGLLDWDDLLRKVGRRAMEILKKLLLALKSGLPSCLMGGAYAGLGSLTSGLVNAWRGTKSYCTAVTDALCDTLVGCLEPVSEPSGESCRRPFSSRSMRFINWKSGL